MASGTYESFLQLVRLGIGTSKEANISKDVDWARLKALADEQGLTAVLLDGIDKLPADNRPSQIYLLEWIGDVLQNYEQRYEQYKKAIGILARFYNQHGFKMMVLKGYACSLDWPIPEHRPCGDIDIWQFGQYKAADAALTKGKGIEIDKSHHHHTVFCWGDFMVENHYDFVNVYHSKSNAEIEKVFKDLGNECYTDIDTTEKGFRHHCVEVCGEKVYLPSSNLHALFLLRHSMIEFVASSISLRQLLDWAFFVRANATDIDWGWLESELERFGMKKLYDVYNAICVGDLGFDANLFPEVQFDPSMKDMVLYEIISPAIPNEKPKALFPRMIWKYRRWKANEWKHRLVYKEGIWSSFWSGVWGHLLKPASI